MSKAEALLNEYTAALDEARERRAGSGNPSDVVEELDLIERMTLDCVRGLLEDLGEKLDPDEPAEQMITRASAAIRRNEDRFVKGAPLVFLERQVGRLNQDLRDLRYLREGYGLGSGRPKPSDMKWSNATAVSGDVHDTVRQVTAELKSDRAEVHRLVPEVRIDLASTRKEIIGLLARNVGASEFMEAVIDLGKRQAQLAGWDSFYDLPYDSELKEHSSFFVDVIKKNPPKAPLIGLYAGISYPIQRGETVADIDLTGADTYEPDSEEWFGDINYWPAHSLAQSEVLASIYRLAHAPGGLGHAAEYTLCLSWAAYFARACARRYLKETGSDFIGLRAGFNGGDWIEFGWLRTG